MATNHSISPHIYSYKHNGKLVSTWYDLDEATYCYRIDWNPIRRFHTSDERDAAVEDELNPNPACPQCGRTGRRMVANPVNADQRICWRCAKGNAAMLAEDAREWDYDRRPPVGL
jgi:hypothetical protein